MRIINHAVNLLVVILGDLTLTRALADFRHKKNRSMTAEKQIITADPDITMHNITDDDEFLVLACDGTSRRLINLTLIFTNFCRYLGLFVFAASR